MKYVIILELMTIKTTKVVIIGAGAAGIGAAEFLHNNSIDFIVVEARDRLGGRIWTNEFQGFVVEMGANWIHGQYDEGYNSSDANSSPKFTNPVWAFKQSNKGVLEGDFTDYESSLAINEKGEVITDNEQELAWENVEESIEKCNKYGEDLWNQYCKEGKDLKEVEKKDMSIKDCVFNEMEENIPMDRKSVAIRDAIIWEEIEFETGIFNHSLMHLLPLNNVDRIGYNDNDWFIKNG